MGDGEFIGNASIHWKIRHQADLDDIRLDDNHVPNNRKGVSLAKRRVHGRDPDRELANLFEVTLRFDDIGDAQTAFADAIAGATKVGNEYYVTVRLPAPQRANPNVPRPDVKVRW